jgi:hypothetical protein
MPRDPYDIDITGYEVEASDGAIGRVDEVVRDAEGTSYIVVDTGPWIFGKKMIIPVSVETRIDSDEEKIYVGYTKDEIKSAPEFDETRYGRDEYRERIGEYYGRLPGGPKEDPDDEREEYFRRGSV